MHLYLIRHGQSEVNAREDWNTLPNLDTSLTDKGHRQAMALRDWMRDNQIKADALYCSTMRRAQETAQYVAEAVGIAPINDDRLREISAAYRTGEPVSAPDLPRSYAPIKAFDAAFRPMAADVDGGESWMQGRVRLGEFMDTMLDNHVGKTVMVVAHGGVIAALFDNLFNVGPNRLCDVHNHQTGWTLFGYRPEKEQERWYLWSHNRVDHLAGTDLL